MRNAETANALLMDTLEERIDYLMSLIMQRDKEIAQLRKNKLEFKAQCFHKDVTIEVLENRITELQADNRSLVEQMNETALQHNQEVITWHKWPGEMPDMIDKGGHKIKKVLIKYRLENAPEELVGIDTYWESPYINGFESTCDPNVSVLAWAYLPKGVNNG